MPGLHGGLLLVCKALGARRSFPVQQQRATLGSNGRWEWTGVAQRVVPLRSPFPPAPHSHAPCPSMPARQKPRRALSRAPKAKGMGLRSRERAGAQLPLRRGRRLLALRRRAVHPGGRRRCQQALHPPTAGAPELCTPPAGQTLTAPHPHALQPGTHLTSGICRAGPATRTVLIRQIPTVIPAQPGGTGGELRRLRPAAAIVGGWGCAPPGPSGAPGPFRCPPWSLCGPGLWAPHSSAS